MSVNRFQSAEFLKFLAVGLINTLFGYSVYAALVLSGLMAPVALVCSHIAGVCFNFGSLGQLFGSHALQKVPRYMGAHIAILSLNLLMLAMLTNLGMNALLAQAIATIAIAPMSYLVMRRFVFKEAT